MVSLYAANSVVVERKKCSGTVLAQEEIGSRHRCSGELAEATKKCRTFDSGGIGSKLPWASSRPLSVAGQVSVLLSVVTSIAHPSA